MICGSPPRPVRRPGRCALGPINASYPCAIVRDRRYLDWAVLASVGSRLHLLAGGGLLVGPDRRHGRPGSRQSDGLNLRAPADPGDAKAIAALLRAATAHLRGSVSATSRAWLSAHGKLRECAQATGFRPVDFRLLRPGSPPPPTVPPGSPSSRRRRSSGAYRPSPTARRSRSAGTRRRPPPSRSPSTVASSPSASRPSPVPGARRRPEPGSAQPSSSPARRASGIALTWNGGSRVGRAGLRPLAS